MADLNMVSGDTEPALTAVLTDGANGQPVDLTGATQILCVIRRAGRNDPLITRVVYGDANGVVTMPWEAGDLDDVVGILLVEWKVTWPAGGPQTFPANGQKRIKVRGS